MNKRLSIISILFGSVSFAISSYVYGVGTVDYGITKWPVSVTINGDTPQVFGQVYVQGITDISIGHDDGVLAQLGYGPYQTDPTISANWLWGPAVPNLAFNDPALDEYVGTLSIYSTGTFSYAFRFSADGGTNWTAADLDGTVNGLSTAMLGTATVLAPVPEPETYTLMLAGLSLVGLTAFRNKQ